LDRVFCIFEAVATLEAKRHSAQVKLSAALTLPGYLASVPSMMPEVNVAMAKSRNEKDKATIMEFVDALACDGMTGREFTNLQVTHAMRTAMAQAERGNTFWLLTSLLICEILFFTALYVFLRNGGLHLPHNSGAFVFVAPCIQEELGVTFQQISIAKLRLRSSFQRCSWIQSSCHVLWKLLTFLFLSTVVFVCMSCIIAIPLLPLRRIDFEDSVTFEQAWLISGVSVLAVMASPVAAITQHVVRVPLQLMDARSERQILRLGLVNLSQLDLQAMMIGRVSQATVVSHMLPPVFYNFMPSRFFWFMCMFMPSLAAAACACIARRCTSKVYFIAVFSVGVGAGIYLFLTTEGLCNDDDDLCD